MASVLLIPAEHGDAETLELVGTSGVFLSDGNDGLFPTPTYDETYVESAYTEGALRVRSRPENIVGNGQVHILGDDANDLWGHIATWQRTIDAMRIYGGILRYIPDYGSSVDFLVVSAKIASIASPPVAAGQGYAVSTFELTYRPYGLLDQEAIVVNANGTDPLLTFEVPAFGGAVDGLGLLLLTDTASQARNHLEGGLESHYYESAAPWPLFVDSASMTALESASTNAALAGEYGDSSLHQTLSTTAKGVGMYTSSHVGRFRVKARVYATATTVSVRVGYSTRGGGITYNNWVAVPVANGWFEADLGIVNFLEPMVGSQSVSFYIYAKASAATPAVDLDYLKFIPAERYWKASGAVGGVATVRSGRFAEVRWDSILTETADGVWAEHPNAVGSYLRIPRRGGRIAVSLNRADLDSEAHTPLGDAMRADLTVIPRVPLLGP